MDVQSFQGLLMSAWNPHIWYPPCNRRPRKNLTVATLEIECPSFLVPSIISDVSVSKFKFQPSLFVLSLSPEIAQSYQYITVDFIAVFELLLGTGFSSNQSCFIYTVSRLSLFCFVKS